MTEIAETKNSHDLMNDLAVTCGLNTPRSMEFLIQHVANSILKNIEHDNLSYQMIGNGIYDMLHQIAPQGMIETMLTIQMIATHFTAVGLLKHSDSAHRSDSICKSTQLSMKLLKTFTEQLNALRQYRLKGKQEIRVEHISINGGQNVLGSVKTGEA